MKFRTGEWHIFVQKMTEKEQHVRDLEKMLNNAKHDLMVYQELYHKILKENKQEKGGI